MGSGNSKSSGDATQNSVNNNNKNVSPGAGNSNQTKQTTGNT